jgi:DNA-binding beta-propeller fold protein YncE
MSVFRFTACRLGSRLLLVVACVLAASGLLVPFAQASSSPLYAGCIGDLAGCTQTSPAGALDGASAVAFGPFIPFGVGVVYAASGIGNDLSEFWLTETGSPLFKGCVGNLAGCTPTTPPTALDGADAVAVAVTATSRTLYVASSAGNDVSQFQVGKLGSLTYDGCVGNLTGCTPVTAGALAGADGLAVSPGGTDLYATALGGDVTHFQIGPAGNLTFTGCTGNLTGCSPVTAGALSGARGIVVNPADTDLYATAVNGNVLDQFQISPAGNLTFAGCTGGLAGCTPTTPATALDGADGLAVNPAGTELYTTSVRGNVVSQFQISPAGTPTFAGCTGDLAGCTPTTPTSALNGASNVAVITTRGVPQVYVSSGTGGDVSEFQIGPAGNLTFAGCTGGLAGCTQISLPAALAGAAGLTGTNGHLYAAASFGNALSHFTLP